MVPSAFRPRCLVAVLVVALFALAASAASAAADMPLAEWHLDQETGGETPDASGHGNDLGLDGASILAGEGRWGGALSLAGEGERAGATGNAGLEPTAVTVVAWVRRKSGEAPGEYRYVLGDGGSDSCSPSSYALYTGGGKGLEFYFYDGSTFHSSPAASAASVWDGQWHAVAGTYDGSTVRLYVDGNQVGSGTPASGAISYAQTNPDLVVGDYPVTGCGSHSLRADLDEVRVYGRALSAGEVSALADPSASSPPELLEAGGGSGPPAPIVHTLAIARAAKKLVIGKSTIGSKLSTWLSAKSSTPTPGAHFTHFDWDTDGDGSTDVTCPGDAPALFTQFPKSGTYDVTVTAVDSSGQSSTGTVYTTVHAPAHVPLGASASATAHGSKAKKAVEESGESACITQLEGNQPSSKDCIRSFQFGVIDVNARTQNCFTLVGQSPSTNYVGQAGTSASNFKTLPKLFYDASIKGSVSLDGLPIPIPEGRTTHYSSVTGTIGAGEREIAIELAGHKVSLGRLNLDLAIETTRKHGRNFFSLGSVDLAGLPGLAGLGVTGKAGIGFIEPGETELALNLKLPPLFSFSSGPATAKLEVYGRNEEEGEQFRLGHLHVHVPSFYVGPVLGKNLDLDYDEATDTWAGGLALLLPGGEEGGDFELDAEPKPGTDYGIQISNGHFQHAGAEVDFGSFSPQIFPGVFLSNLRFTVGTEPLRLFGGGTLNTAKIVYVDGDVLAVFPESGESWTIPGGLQGFQRLAGRRVDSFSLAGGGDVSFRVSGFSFPLGNAFLMYTYPGLFEFGGEVDVPLGVFEAKGEASAFVDVDSGRFNAEGNGTFCIADDLGCLGASMLVSSDGIAGCGEIDVGLFDVNAGAGYHWGGSFHVYLLDCDVGPYRVYTGASQLQAPAAAGWKRTLHLPAQLPAEDFELRGLGGAPDVTLRGPHGQVFSTEGKPKGGDLPFAFIRVDANDTTYIGIKNPAAGAWTVSANPGSVPIASLAAANGLKPPSVKATVAGRGPHRVLHYEIAPRPGQRVVFAEKGKDSYREIGHAKGGSGTIRFTPAFGSAGRRKLTALVQQNGATIQTLKLGSYKAPGWGSPKRPRKLLVSRHGATLKVSWQPQPGVRRFTVTVRTADGAARMLVVHGASAKIKGVAAALAGRVTVAGTEIDGSSGPAATAKLRPAR
ncbi:MAG TPA: LamG-like jellyroll fold domain-containing protein [Solirubrobacterales bacterium]|nr:LamG-like jellyroll fold domain-containing protein [Solirubrobacterales bacterium]